MPPQALVTSEPPVRPPVILLAHGLPKVGRTLLTPQAHSGRMRGPRTALLLALLLAAGLAPTAEAADACDSIRNGVYHLGPLSVRELGHRCRYYNLAQKAHVTERVERYDAFRGDPPGENETKQPLFTQMTLTLEWRYLDGRTDFQRRTLLAVGDAWLHADYLEQRTAQGKATCHGAAEGRFGYVPGRLGVPTTPDYPACAPPGLLA